MRADGLVSLTLTNPRTAYVSGQSAQALCLLALNVILAWRGCRSRRCGETTMRPALLIINIIAKKKNSNTVFNMCTVYRYVPNHCFVSMHLVLREGLLYYILRVTTRVACMLILIKQTLSRPEQRLSLIHI